MASKKVHTGGSGHGKPSPNSSWKTLVHFVTHIVIATLLFVAVALPAIGLNLWVHHLETLNVSEYIIWVITGVEYFFITADAVVLIVLVCKSTWKAVKEFEL